MIKIDEKSQCCGCTACYNACPKSAINMLPDEEGFLYPKIDFDKCVNCGICNQVCPVEHKIMPSKGERKSFAIRTKNKDVLINSTSGGFITPLATYVLENNGTGAAKVGGNYAASLLPGKLAKSRHFSDVIYLDPSTHTKIEEVGSANFFGITADNEFVTPLSPSILPSITKYSLLYLAEHRLGLTPIEGDVPIDNLDRFVEAGACGTAAVISPIGGIQHGDDFHVFYSETEVGPVTRKLYDELTGIQFGDVEAPEGWIVKVD